MRLRYFWHLISMFISHEKHHHEKFNGNDNREILGRLSKYWRNKMISILEILKESIINVANGEISTE